jgi:hypothetical protein
MRQACVPGRRYRACMDANNQRSYRFEDGKVLQGNGAAQGYCYGATDGSSDGNCTGSWCSVYYEPASCEPQTTCDWAPATLETP